MPMDSCPGQRLEYARVPGPLLCGLNDSWINPDLELLVVRLLVEEHSVHLAKPQESFKDPARTLLGLWLLEEDCGNFAINALLTDHLTPELVISRTPNRAKITKLAPITKSTGCWPYLSME